MEDRTTISARISSPTENADIVDAVVEFESHDMEAFIDWLAPRTEKDAE